MSDECEQAELYGEIAPKEQMLTATGLTR